MNCWISTEKAIRPRKKGELILKNKIQRNRLTLKQIPLNQCLQKIVKSAIFCGLGETKEIYHRA
jgi:hypothetical protein